MRPDIAFVGAGNVAFRFSLALQEKGYNISYVYSRTERSRDKLVRALQANGAGTQAAGDYRTLARAAVVFIAVSDDAIESVVSGMREELAGMDSLPAVVHTSGATDISRLPLRSNVPPDDAQPQQKRGFQGRTAAVGVYLPGADADTGLHRFELGRRALFLLVRRQTEDAFGGRLHHQFRQLPSRTGLSDSPARPPAADSGHNRGRAQCISPHSGLHSDRPGPQRGHDDHPQASGPAAEHGNDRAGGDIPAVYRQDSGKISSQITAPEQCPTTTTKSGSTASGPSLSTWTES